MEGAAQEEIHWTVENHTNRVSDEADKYETNDPNDLLYMYSATELVKVENNPQKDSKEGYVPKTPWKLYSHNSQSVATAHTLERATPNNDSKESFIRLKCKDELFNFPEKSGLQDDRKEMVIKMNDQVILSPSTSSPPSTSTPGVQRGVSTIMWIHLQASICTEWAQQQLVLKHGARQPALDKVDTVVSNTRKSTFQQELDCLHQVQTSNKKPAIIKAPKTIHRCILKTCSNSKSQNDKGIECHVCNVPYMDYNTYFTHLMDSTCMKNQEGLKINNTRMTIYAPQIRARKSIQSSVYSPSNTGKYWNRKNITSFDKPLTNYTRSIHQDSGEKDHLKHMMRQQEGDQVKSTTSTRLNGDIRSYNSSMPIESDSDQEIQIISELRTETNNEPTHKKIRLSVDKSTDQGKKENCMTNHWSLQNVQTEQRSIYTESTSNIPPSNFDEKAASETLLLLSSSNSNKEDETEVTDDTEINQDITEPQVASSSSLFNLPILCPCEAARRLTNITREENSKDEDCYSDFMAKLDMVLLKVLGEPRLNQLGYPGLSGSEVLEKVLRLTGTTVTREDDLCTQDCKVGI